MDIEQNTGHDRFKHENVQITMDTSIHEGT